MPSMLSPGRSPWYWTGMGSRPPFGSSGGDGDLDRRDLLFALASLAVVVALFLAWFGSMPVYGDGLGYGYASARWMENNGLTPFPAGEERGERAMGHPALFFWLWAVLMRVLGNTVTTAHLLPALSVWLALLGTWRLGRRLGGPALGMASAAALMASPLFLAQGFRVLPLSAAAAASVWSIHVRLQGRLLPAVALCWLSVAMREQTLVLAGALLLVELRENGLRRPLRLLAAASPVLVLVLNGLASLLTIGYFLEPSHTPRGGVGNPLGSILRRLQYFGWHLFGRGYRWFPALVGVVAAGRGLLGLRLAIPAAAVVAALALLPGMQAAYLLSLLAICVALLLRAGRWPDGPVLLMGSYVLLMLLLMASIFTLTGGGMTFEFYRHFMGVYPVLMLLLLMPVVRHLPRLPAALAAAVFAAATGISGTEVLPGQPDATPAGVITALEQARAAGSWAAARYDRVIVPEPMVTAYREPAVGFTDEPLPMVSVGKEWDHLEEGLSNCVLDLAFLGDDAFFDFLFDHVPPWVKLEPDTSWVTGELRTACLRLTGSPP